MNCKVVLRSELVSNRNPATPVQSRSIDSSPPAVVGANNFDGSFLGGAHNASGNNSVFAYAWLGGLIAATATVHDLIVVTRNVADFDDTRTRREGLQSVPLGARALDDFREVVLGVLEAPFHKSVPG